MFVEKAECLITTWETRFVPGILKLAECSRVSIVKDLLDELDNIDVEDYEPSQGETGFMLRQSIGFLDLSPWTWL